MADEIEQGVNRATSRGGRSRARDIPSLLERLVVGAGSFSEDATASQDVSTGVSPEPPSPEDGGAGQGLKNVSDPQAELEFVTLSALVMASRDMRSLMYSHMRGSLMDPDIGSSILQAIVEIPTTRVAMVNRKRQDVPRAEWEGARARQFALVWEKTELTTSLRTNVEADQQHQYNHGAWKQDLLSALDEAVRHEANLICFGEFDYPPGFSDGDDRDADEARFKQDVFRILDRSKKPCVAVLGTSHRRMQLPNQDSTSGIVSEYRVENIAQVFFSSSLLDSVEHKRIQNPKGVWKVTPASKVGERLSRPKDIRLYGFNAVFGRVAVLVCSDAYDPSIIFELFARSQDSNEKPDFIVVPSYNGSEKFPELCQVLSLMTNSVVVMVDAHDGDNEYCGKTQIWVCGIPAQDFSGEVWRELDVCASAGIATFPNSPTSIEFWDINRAGLSELIDRLDHLEPIPVFRDVREQLKEDARGGARS